MFGILEKLNSVKTLTEIKFYDGNSGLWIETFSDTCLNVLCDTKWYVLIIVHDTDNKISEVRKINTVFLIENVSNRKNFDPNEFWSAYPVALFLPSKLLVVTV